MSKRIYSNLSWLPTCPNDFAARCRSLFEAGDNFGSRVQELASFSLDENQLIRLAKAIAKGHESGLSFAPLTSFRLGIVSNSTTDFIIPGLIASAARHGIDLECIPGSYDQVMQEALDPDSAINRRTVDAVLVAVDYRGLPFRASAGNAEEHQHIVDGVLDYFQAIRAGIKKSRKIPCILQTLAAPPEALFGNLDGALPGTMASITDSVNRRLVESVAGTEDVLLDVARLAQTVGLEDWHAPSQWNLAKLPFSNSLVPFYADHVSRVIAALRGKSRRCLILDLDNTLWGGVIGDDGLSGIQIAQGDPVGEAFLNLQTFALALRGRGIVLAVCSKNDDGVARSPFREHAEMVLRENHFAVFQANWNDKATNIKAIADELALGLESIVFLDDSPVERALVRKLLPQVAVPELPDDPALYARTLSAAGYFESVSFSNEDAKRAEFYEGNARRVAVGKQSGDIQAYLASLKMEITFQPFDDTGRARIAQLINKSNQFNLTTRRYTEAEVADLARDPQCFTLQVRLSDMFGDNGMISVVVCRRGTETDWNIDTWLMSCRVLGRGVEKMVLRELVEQARRHGVRRLIGTYRPTDRNKIVEQHYAKLGFTQIGQSQEGDTTWELGVEGAAIQAVEMSVRRTGFDLVEV